MFIRTFCENYTVSQKTPTFYFMNNSVKKQPIFDDFWQVKFWENVTWKSYRLVHLTCQMWPLYLGKSPKVIFNSIVQSYILLIIYVISWEKQTVIHLPTLLENVTTLTFELKNFFIWLKVCILSDVGEPIVGCHRWLWKEPVVMCGNWNVRQTLSQQVFRVTTFCINACFQSFSTVICHIVHRAVLKFGPCRNKSLPQASTCPHTGFSCSVPQMQY